MTTGLVDHIVVAGLIGLLTWAAASDFRSYTIPNNVALSIAVLYPAHVAASPAAVDWVGGAAVAAVILTVGIVLFALRVAGGGDVKLLAATALWAGPAQIVPFLLLVSVTGAVLAMAAASHLHFIRPWPSGALAPDQEAAVKLRQSVPYGIAIAAGGLWVASRMLLG
jgi:prepilin peptidase CpaA